jgi:hypothetical protein
MDAAYLAKSELVFAVSRVSREGVFTPVKMIMLSSRKSPLQARFDAEARQNLS